MLALPRTDSRDGALRQRRRDILTTRSRATSTRALLPSLSARRAPEYNTVEADAVVSRRVARLCRSDW